MFENLLLYQGIFRVELERRQNRGKRTKNAKEEEGPFSKFYSSTSGSS